MINTLIELTVSILSLSSVFMAGKKNILAWPALILAQSIFLIYAIAIGTTGFFLLNIGMIVIAIRNFILWRKAKDDG
jgi:hypothetical protein